MSYPPLAPPFYFGVNKKMMGRKIKSIKGTLIAQKTAGN
jgi:hypothetical protein